MLADFDQRSQAANVPLYIPQSLIPIGLGLTAILTAARLITKPVQRATPRESRSDRGA